VADDEFTLPQLIFSFIREPPVLSGVIGRDKAFTEIGDFASSVDGVEIRDFSDKDLSRLSVCSMAGVFA